MASSSTADVSPLDKPLHLLTEHDITQLTREDCRRYLKLKGMRRPSWNKSQAIQQVISLKALLEPTPQPETVSQLTMPRVPPLNTADPVDGTSTVAAEKRGPSEFQLAVSVKESATPVSPRKDYATHHFENSASGADLAAGSPRVSRDTSLEVKQLTIFYSGKFNVYDDVSRDKAQTLLQLAATPLNGLMDSPCDETAVPHPHVSVSLPKTSATRAGPNYLRPNLQASQTVEGASSRKACVQRYREKRKDRFKRKVGDLNLSAKCSPARNTIGDLNLSANNTDTDEL